LWSSVIAYNRDNVAGGTTNNSLAEMLRGELTTITVTG
jgi:hypothetical protein